VFKTTVLGGKRGVEMLRMVTGGGSLCGEQNRRNMKWEGANQWQQKKAAPGREQTERAGRREKLVIHRTSSLRYKGLEGQFREKKRFDSFLTWAQRKR